MEVEIIRVSLTRPAVNALWAVMRTRGVTNGRVEMRQIKRIQTEVRQRCSHPPKLLPGQVPNPDMYEVNDAGGTIELPRELFNFMVDMIDDKLDKKDLTGADAMAFDELIEAIEPFEEK